MSLLLPCDIHTGLYCICVSCRLVVCFLFACRLVVLSQGNVKDSSSLKRKHDETLNDEFLTMLKVGDP